MGRINYGPNGPFSGKTGNVVGSSWRGIFYIKGLQKKILKPRSQRQLEQQARFATAVKFLFPIKSVLNRGFADVNPAGATGYNMAISHLLNTSIKGTYPNFEIDYPSVVIARGKQKLPATTELKWEADKLWVTWDPHTLEYDAAADDNVVIVVFSENVSEFTVEENNILRKQGGIAFGIPPEFHGGRVHVYLYLVRRDEKKWSDSKYVGVVDAG